MKFNPFRILLIVLLASTLVQYVYAQEDDSVNLLDLPSHLANALGIPEFSAELLTCSVFMLMFLLPIAIFSKGNLLLILLIGFLQLGFFVAVGWMDFWFILVIGLIVAGLWSSKMKGWIS